MRIIAQSPRERISSILASLNDGLFERKEAMNLAFLSAIAGESIFLLGPPGVAKSMIARRLKFAFRDSQAFEYLMNRFSTPDEIFGPVSIKKLKDEDKYERITDKYLPGSNIVFLDEIWKAGPSIQNALLTILNEKVYRNGEQEVKVNLRGIISASNELPAEGQGLEALWDRFLIRIHVTGIQERENFKRMITETRNLYLDNITDKVKILEEELIEWSDSIDQIQVPEEVLSLVDFIRLALDEQNKKSPDRRIYVSDRRWKKIVRTLKTSAFLNGRVKVDLMDCFLIAHCIWEMPDQIELVREIISRTIRQHAYTINLRTDVIEKGIKEFRKEIEKETTVRTPLKEKEIAPIKFRSNKSIPDGDYYEVLEYEERVNHYVSVDTYESLPRNDDEMTIDLYYEDKRYSSASFIEVNARRVGKYQIEIDDYRYTLKVKEVEKEKVSTRRPHPVVKTDWDKRVLGTKDQIKKAANTLDKYVETDLSGIHENLFVQAGYANVVESKLSDLRKQLSSFDLEIEKLKDYYESITDDEKKEKVIPAKEPDHDNS